MAVPLLVAFLCVGLAFTSRVEAGEHLLFRSVVQVDYGNRYRIALSLHLRENDGVWEAFEVRRIIETIDSDEQNVSSQASNGQTISIGELAGLGEKGFSLLAVPGTSLNVIYLKALDAQNPSASLGLSYPIDARPGEKKWGWLPLSIERSGSAFRLLTVGGTPYDCIETEVNYQNYWGLKPVGLCVFRPWSSEGAPKGAP